MRFGAEHTFMRLLLLEITPALPQLVSIPPPLNGATARLMRRGEAYVRFPLKLSHQY